MLLSDLGGPPRPLLLFLLALLFLVDPLRLLLLANIDQHLAHGRTDLTLYAFAPQLALVGQVVEVGEALGIAGLLARCKDREDGLATYCLCGFLGLGPAGVVAAFQLLGLVVVAGDDDGLVRVLLMQCAGDVGQVARVERRDRGKAQRVGAD